MKENDVITITLKGKDAKKYFLERTTEKLGVRFQEIPKDSLILEEIGSSKMAVEIFKDALEMNFLEDVDFKVGKITKQTEGKNIESENLPISTNEKPNRKGLGDDQREILRFMENHREEEFSINSLSIATDYIKSKLRIILPSLVKRNLIERKKFKNSYVYFCIAEDTTVDENVESIPETTEMESDQLDIEDSISMEKTTEKTSETLEEKALAKQSAETKRIRELFTIPKYLHILNNIFKNDSFSVEAIRRKCNHEEATALTEVIRVLSGEAIQYSPDDDDIYNVNIIWRTYSLVRLGQKDIETEKSPEILELLLTKGLIYEEPEGKYNIVM